MNIKKFFKLAFGFALTVGALNVAMTKTNNKAVQTNAADVTTGSVLMNTNGNIRYISKGDNPDVWSSETSEKLNYGRFSFNDFTNKGGISNGWGTPASDGSGTLSNTPFTYTGRASNSMTFTESVASGNCVGLYIPICFYAASVPAYTKVTFKVDIDLNFDYRLQYIDLALPSGTKWAKCNLGADVPEEYGNFYLWGYPKKFVQSKSKFNEDTYALYVRDYTGKREMILEDDAAYIETNGLARIPSEQQYQELIDNCKYEWVELNGIKGAKFTSYENNKSIFIPAAGYCYNPNVYDKGNYAFLWTRSLCNAYNSREVFSITLSGSGKLHDISAVERYFALSIRPVKID